MDDSYITSLQKEIEQKDKDLDAMRQELNSDEDMAADVVKSSLIPEVPSYIKNIDALAHASESESVRLQANKLLVEWAITDKLVAGGDATDDEFKKLLKNLAGKSKKDKEKEAK